MTEWFENMKENFSVSDVIAFLSMIGAIIAAIVAWINKRKSAKSEAQAAQYAKNADEANKSAQKYYDEMYGHLKKQDENEVKESKKKKIILNMYPTIKLTANEIAKKVGFSENETLEMLRELELDGIVIFKRDVHGKETWKLKG